jgi:uncharacterized membrane protein
VDQVRPGTAFGADEEATTTRKRLHVWLPFAVTAAVLVLFGLFHGPRMVFSLVLTAVGSFFLYGKFIILAGVGHPHLTPWELAVMVLYMDLLTAFLLSYNLDVVYRIRRVGPRLNRLQDYGRYTLRTKPFLRRLSFLGLVLFVLFPVAATGAIGGSIFGRLLGMRPYRIVLGIGIGSAFGCGAMAWGTQAIRDVAQSIQHEWWFQASGFAVIGLLVLLLAIRYRALERRIMAEGLGEEGEEAG